MSWDVRQGAVRGRAAASTRKAVSGSGGACRTAGRGMRLEETVLSNAWPMRTALRPGPVWARVVTESQPARRTSEPMAP